MRRLCLALFVTSATTIAIAAPEFLNVWKSPEVSRLNFAGKKVAALVITDSQSLQMSGEEALTRELTARGVTGTPTYRFVPREELKSAETAKGWFERAKVEGVVALRPVRTQKEREVLGGRLVVRLLSELLGLLRLRVEQRLRDASVVQRSHDDHRRDIGVRPHT